MKAYVSSFYYNPLIFGMNSSGQVYSHIILMKVSICIIAFEVYQRSLKKTIYDLEEYRIPINVEGVYENFHSLSFKARKAM